VIFRITVVFQKGMIVVITINGIGMTRIMGISCTNNADVSTPRARSTRMRSLEVLAMGKNKQESLKQPLVTQEFASLLYIYYNIIYIYTII